jgi:alkanesulfonate monooxygenase SsuD/methylene tetrahydromethanopterin reductase-like flavin-dependent oxidoreductase (luciferase family)
VRVSIAVLGPRGNFVAMREAALEIEAAGGDAIGIADHIAHPPDRPMIDPFILASVVALATSRIRIILGVAALTFREPGILAKMATGVSLVSGGRFILGIGTGVRQAEHDMFGIRFPAAGERVSRLDEYVQVVKALCQPTGDPVTFEGRYYRMAGARNLPPPTAPIPILVGGAGDRVLGVVARHADIWDIADDYLDRVGERSAKLDELLAKTGRTVQRTIQVPMSVTAPTPEQLQQHRASLGWGAFGDADAMMARIVELVGQGHFDEISLVPMGGRASFDRALELIPIIGKQFSRRGAGVPTA